MHRDGLTPDVFVHLRRDFANDPDTKEFYNSQSKVRANEDQLMACCSTKCKEFCITPDETIVRDGREWINADDPCISHICNKGIVSNHTSVCSGLPCSQEHYVVTPGKCCPTCDADWASFCPEDEDCDIACQHGFVVDLKRGCDLCRCARRKAPFSSTSPPATSQKAPVPTDDAPPRSVHFYFYLDPTADVATRNLLLGIAVASCVILVACLAGIAWFFHRRVYKRVPLLSFTNSSTA